MLFGVAILLSVAWTTAMPASTPADASPPGGFDDPGYEQSARAKNAMGCTVFWPPDAKTSLMQCKDVCGAAIAQEVAAGNTSSVSCISINPQWQPFDGSVQVAGAYCSCNNPLIDELADDFVSALPALAEIGCDIFMSAFNTVLQLGATAIPILGEAIDAGMIAGISAAKLSAYVYDANDLGFSAFSNWLNPCVVGQLPSGAENVFTIWNGVDALLIPGGFKIPKGVKPGSGKPGDKGDPNPPKASQPPDPAPTQPEKPSLPAESDPAPTQPEKPSLPAESEPAPPEKSDPPVASKTGEDPSQSTPAPTNTPKPNLACPMSKRAVYAFVTKTVT